MKRNAAIVTVLALALALGAWGDVSAGNAGKVRAESFRLLNAGVAAYKRGAYEEAIVHLTKSSSMALNSFRAHYYLGLALIGNRQYQEALAPLEIALELDPLHLNALVAYGDSYLRQGDIGEAEAAYYRALRIRPEHPAALDGIARAYDARAKSDQAIGYYRRAIESNRGFAPAYTHLGELYLRLGRLEDAVEVLTEAVTVRPDYAPALNRLALALTRIGLFNEAVATIQEAIELQPEDASHRAMLGMIQVDLGLLARAEETFNHALEMDPFSPEGCRGMAEVHRRRGDYDDSLALLDHVLSDERLGPRMRNAIEDYRASVVAERERCIALQAIEADGTATPEQLRELATLYAGRELWQEAADLEERTAPEGLERDRLAFYQLRAGRYRDALEAYTTLTGLAARADLEVNLGVALAGLGRDEEAIRAYRRALELDSGQPEARLYLGNALLRLGRNEEAIAAFRSFLVSPDGSTESKERIRRVLEIITGEETES